MIALRIVCRNLACESRTGIAQSGIVRMTGFPVAFTRPADPTITINSLFKSTGQWILFSKIHDSSVTRDGCPNQVHR